MLGSMPPTLSLPERTLLQEERDRAERRLNAVRAMVLMLLAVFAVAYAPTLSPQLNRDNVVILTPMLCWTAAQYLFLYRRPRLPSWLSVINPVVDITGVTLIMWGYGLASSASLAVKSPMILAYFAILAARPIASSVQKAAFVAVLASAEYGSLVAFFVLTGRIPIATPVTASMGPATSLLDEMVKILLLVVAGGVATYATWWHEELVRRYSAESREREALRERLAASQLESLKLQLHPHFLFNALNVITALVHTDADAAERMIAGLSELIRVALHSAGDQEVTLQRELEVLGHYINIQQIRFADRLTIVTRVDPDVQRALVPTLILQPLVENAITHGIAPRATPGCIEIVAAREGDLLSISVYDDGVGVRGRALQDIVERVGLGNARARLASLYGDRQTFIVESPPDGGFRVRMTFPYHTVELPVRSPRALTPPHPPMAVAS